MTYQFDQIDGNDAWLTRVVRMMFLASFYVMFVNIAIEGLKRWRERQGKRDGQP
jgi:hypothetical protein